MEVCASVYKDYRKAKAASGELAIAMRFRLLQGADGKPRVVTTTGTIKRFPTWLASFTWLYAVWLDRQPKAVCNPMPVMKESPIPWAIVLD